jgi:plasmid stability protein
MAQILIRGLSERTVARWKAAAKSNGRSLQAELKEHLERQAPIDRAAVVAAAERMRDELRGKTGGDSTDLIRELRE